jgi:hypothetical protein
MEKSKYLSPAGNYPLVLSTFIMVLSVNQVLAQGRISAAGEEV